MSGFFTTHLFITHYRWTSIMIEEQYGKIPFHYAISKLPLLNHVYVCVRELNYKLVKKLIILSTAKRRLLNREGDDVMWPCYYSWFYMVHYTTAIVMVVMKMQYGCYILGIEMMMRMTTMTWSKLHFDRLHNHHKGLAGRGKNSSPIISIDAFKHSKHCSTLCSMSFLGLLGTICKCESAFLKQFLNLLDFAELKQWFCRDSIVDLGCIIAEFFHELTWLIEIFVAFCELIRTEICWRVSVGFLLLLNWGFN